MGIKALKLTSVDRYVSDFDPGKNAVVANQPDIDAWTSSKAKDKGPQPLPQFSHAPEATVWLLGTLDSMTMAMLSDDITSITESGGLNIRNADNDVVAARLGLKGWENFTSEDGEPVLFATETIIIKGRRYDALTQELTEAIPVPVLREIGQQIKRHNSLTALEAKNSASASSL